MVKVRAVIEKEIALIIRDVPSRVLGRVLRHFHYSDSAEYYLILDRVLICKQLTFFFT